MFALGEVYLDQGEANRGLSKLQDALQFMPNSTWLQLRVNKLIEWNTGTATESGDSEALPVPVSQDEFTSGM